MKENNTMAKMEGINGLGMHIDIVSVRLVRESSIGYEMNKYLETEIELENTGTESYVFEVEEIDPELIPEEYQNIIKTYTNVMTHLFAYENYYAFILQPFDTEYDEYTLISLVKDDRLIDYKIV